MLTAHMTNTGTSSATWNGPICQTCRAYYLGSHACSAADLTRRIAELQAILDGRSNATSGCPCRPENGGSGVCGCTLAGPQVTC